MKAYSIYVVVDKFYLTFAGLHGREVLALSLDERVFMRGVTIGNDVREF